MKNAKSLLAFGMAAAMALAATGCGGSASSASSAAESTSSASQATEAESASAGSGTLNIMLETPVESLDPQLATDGTSFEVIADYTDGLMQMDADGAAVPACAESYEVSEDGTTYTFHIREDAVWSNGDPVTANDFVFAWQRAVDPANASEYSYMLSDIGQIVNAAEIIAGEKDVSELGVTAVDDKTLEVQLNVPVSYFLSLMYFPTYYPVNQAFFESCGDTFATSPETTLSNGAFVLTSYEPAATAFELVKNEDYYDADKVQLAGLNYQVIQDSQQALMSYQNGDLDTTLLNGEQVDQVKDDPEFTSVGAGYLWYISPNIKEVPELANLNLRLAMTFALDRDSICNDVLKDGCAPTYTAVPPEFAAGPDGSDFSADQTMFADACAYDPDKALEYYEAAKTELSQDTFTFDMVVDADDAPQKVAQVVKEQLETTLPGMTINLTIEPKKQRVEDMQNGNFQLALTRWGPDYADPMTYLGMWVTDNSNNYGFWSNADYDAIIAECTTGDLCTDPEGRWSALYDAEKIVMDEAVIFPLYTQCNAEMVSSAVSGIEFHPVALNRVYKNAVKAG
ncbi:peptide ABC transporter substrate-binding protein [bacterium]|uniref:peptide ABC transporter substrate-binding protein n=1 Tax=Gemmiger sp. TaxID=2049027 RepID=UPI002A90F9C4|nr:peptide ABC transporter substrate-binding protein [Gemmiger sp.]MCI7794576.1 peptide ABC transporter substrate-binding protein [bacterium]MDY5326523.1 peptide ABC transporter substrate-binding protein [Gemmiger sp.]